MMDLDAHALLAIGQAAIDEVQGEFRAGLGSDPLVVKEFGDFATETDLAIENKLRQILVAMTGIPVYGEEYGGDLPLDQTMWVIDPIDGTTNYAAGYPACAIVLSLVHEGQPIVGIIDMPFLSRRVTAAAGAGTFVNGRPVQMTVRAGRPITIAFGSVIARGDGSFPRGWRQELLSGVGDAYRAIRISGSVGVDLASTAAGAFGGTVTFSPHVWDNAAGVLLIRESGGVVTDLEGTPWRVGSVGVLAGLPDVHARLLEVVRSIAPPPSFIA